MANFNDVLNLMEFKIEFNEKCNIDWALKKYSIFSKDITEYYFQCITESMWNTDPFPTVEHYITFKKYGINLNDNGLMHDAAEYHRIDIIEYLCKNGEDINEYDGEYYVLDNFLFGHNSTYHEDLIKSENNLKRLIELGANKISDIYVSTFKEKFKESNIILSIIDQLILIN